MTVASPIILYPITSWTSPGTSSIYYTSNLVQDISGTIPFDPETLEDNAFLTVEFRYQLTRDGVTDSYSNWTTTGITVGTTYVNVTEIPWYLNTDGIVEFLIGDSILFEFRTVKRVSVNQGPGYVTEISTTSSVTASLVMDTSITSSIGIPTGVKIKRAKDTIKVMVPVDALIPNSNSDIVGVNFYISLTPGGGSNGYVQMNETYVTEIDDSETETVVITDSSVTDTAGDITVETRKTRQVDNDYLTFSLTSAVLTRLVTEGKIANVFLSDGVTLNLDLTYYFVATAVAFDRSLNQVIESSYSVELEGGFLNLTSQFRDLPARSRSDVLFSITKTLVSDNSAINVIGGSVVRDTIDPVSNEFERYYIIQDFAFKILSLDALLTFDDSDGDGISDPLEFNLGKKRLADALNIKDGATLQVLIDDQFDKKASDYNITRNEATKSRGKVTFYVNSAPTTSIIIPSGTIVTYPGDSTQGISSVNFAVIGTRIIDASNPDYYFNTIQNRYEIVADIESSLAGSGGNVPANSITAVTGLPSTVLVTNEDPTDFGEDRENNTKLVERCKLGIASVDRGTEAGYARIAMDIPGVEQVRTEVAGDAIMVRDFDADSNRHVGGKVDLYIKGSRVLQYADQVAFKFEHPTDVFGKQIGERFFVTSASDFRVITKNPKVTTATPIVTVNTVRNVTRGRDYSLDNYSIIGDGDTILLSPNQTNLSIGMATLDVIEVDYTYRSSNVLVLQHQPVLEIVSVFTSDGSQVSQDQYRLVELEDPLLTGESSLSSYGIEFLFASQDDVVEFRTVTGELHDMILNLPAQLNLKGVDISSVVVKNADDLTVTYKNNIDYTITVGSEVDSTYINLLQFSKIRSGARVSIDYQANENFLVTYTANSLISQVQTSVNSMKHATADVLVKQAIGNKVDLSMVVVKSGSIDPRYIESDRTIMKSRIQTAVSNYLDKLKMGETFTQSSLVDVVRQVPGVKSVKIPLQRMMKRNGSFIPLDDLGNLTFEVYQRTSSSGVTSYRTLNSVLTYSTTENGGESNLFRAVYENNMALLLMTNPNDVSKGPGRAYIQADGKIIVSTKDGAPPQTKDYKAAYYVLYPADVILSQDITTSEIEYLLVDSISLKDIDIVEDSAVKKGL